MKTKRELESNFTLQVNDPASIRGFFDIIGIKELELN